MIIFLWLLVKPYDFKGLKTRTTVYFKIFNLPSFWDSVAVISKFSKSNVIQKKTTVTWQINTNSRLINTIRKPEIGHYDTLCHQRAVFLIVELVRRDSHTIVKAVIDLNRSLGI